MIPTPCGTCPKPILDEANVGAWEIFNSLYAQVGVGGMGGFSGFNFSSMPFLLTVHGVPRSLWPEVFHKIKAICLIAIEKIASAQAEQRAESETRGQKQRPT